MGLLLIPFGGWRTFLAPRRPAHLLCLLEVSVAFSPLVRPAYLLIPTKAGTPPLPCGSLRASFALMAVGAPSSPCGRFSEVATASGQQEESSWLRLGPET